MEKILIDAKQFLAMAKALETAARSSKISRFDALSNVCVEIGDGALKFAATDGRRLVRYGVERADGQFPFPNIDQVVPATERLFYACRVGVAEIKSVIKAFGKMPANSGAKLSISGGKMLVSAGHSPVTGAVEIQEVDSHGLPEGYEVGVDAKLFTDCLDAAQSPMVTIYFDASPLQALRIQGDGHGGQQGTHDIVLSPMRL